MKRILASITMITIILYSHFIFGAGALFNVNSNNSMLTINTTIPHHTYPNAGIKLNTTGYSLGGQGCTQAKNGYCLFSVSDTEAANISIINGSTSGKLLEVTLCLNGNGPLSCQNYRNLSITPAAKYAYVTQDIDVAPVLLCALNPSTGLITTCQNAGGGGALTGTYPQGITLNNAGTMAYLPDYETASILQCPINSDSTFGTCISTAITSPSGFFSYYGNIVLNPANTIAYIGQYEPTENVIACPINDGIISGACTETGATGFSGYPTGIALNSAGTIAYIGEYSTGRVIVCSVDGSSFSNCQHKTGNGSSITFENVGGVALNNSGSTLYVTDYNSGKVYGCSTPANNATYFNSCYVATFSIPDAWGITLNASNTVAYVTNYDNGVYQCPINADGTFASCVSTTGLDEPVAIALKY